MYIEPNTTIIILKNVPLDPTYVHTLYFDSKEAQAAYFSSMGKYALDVQSYQRVNTGLMRVQRKAEELYDCNYLMFKNTNFGNKWFYAFIRKVEYVNNITSEITFVIDVMQTWLFDYTMEQSFVVREHSASDVIGENTVEEKLEIGPYVENGVTVLDPDNKVTGWTIIFVTTFNDDEELSDSTGRMINGVYTGLNYIGYSGSNVVNQANDLVNRIIGLNKWDGVLAVYMSPFMYDTGSTANQTNQLKHSVSAPKNYSDIDGYHPKNNKLFVYPFNLLHIHTDASSADFRFELFNGNTCQFDIMTTVVPSPAAVLVPKGYATAFSGEAVQREEYRVSISEYPQCAIVGDVYKIYLAQNASSLPTKMSNFNLKSAVNTGIDALQSLLSPPNTASGVVGAVGSIISNLVDWGTETRMVNAQLSDIDTKPSQANGTQTTASDFCLGFKRFVATNLTIRREYARIIDDYFSMYGYATHRVKIPNRNVRKEWTYTKTLGVNLIGSAPADDLEAICKIYDNGITFWKNPANVGNYSLDNSPV